MGNGKGIEVIEVCHYDVNTFTIITLTYYLGKKYFKIRLFSSD